MTPRTLVTALAVCFLAACSAGNHSEELPAMPGKPDGARARITSPPVIVPATVPPSTYTPVEAPTTPPWNNEVPVTVTIIVDPEPEPEPEAPQRAPRRTEPPVAEEPVVEAPEATQGPPTAAPEPEPEPPAQTEPPAPEPAPLPEPPRTPAPPEPPPFRPPADTSPTPDAPATPRTPETPATPAGLINLMLGSEEDFELLWLWLMGY